MDIRFLNEVSRVSEMYNRHRKRSGEDFNIFSVMSIESDEVFTHSALLAELLNPSGSHGLGSKPLQLFIEKLLGREYEMDFSTAHCKKEEHIGFTNADKSEGGRIDIVIKDIQGNIIIIENKIYAAEQTKQLERYKRNYPQAELFYLTLEGKDSDQITESDAKDKIYRNLSYKDDIIDWVTSCAELAFDKPMLREILNQYIYLLKKLTNQTTNQEMAESIQSIIRENFASSFEIYKNFNIVSGALKDELLSQIAKKLKSEYGGLIFQESTFKGDKSIQVKGFPDDKFLRFRFRKNKFPVISFSSARKILNENLLKNFKSDSAQHGMHTYWKILKPIYEEDLFEDKVENTANKYVSDISETINLLLEIDTKNLVTSKP